MKSVRKIEKYKAHRENGGWYEHQSKMMVKAIFWLMLYVSNGAKANRRDRQCVGSPISELY